MFVRVARSRMFFVLSVLQRCADHVCKSLCGLYFGIVQLCTVAQCPEARDKGTETRDKFYR